METDFTQCRVNASGTLLDAMKAIDRGGAQVALVVDAGERLVGTMTDGDVRRALLGGKTLSCPLEPHVRKTFTSVSPEVGRAEVLDMMQAALIDQIPILDSSGKLVGLHLIHEMLGRVDRPNTAVIMAGGKGNRLSPITNSLPKPMLRVAGRPILERIVLHLAGFGIRDIFLAINYLGNVIEEHFGDGSRHGCTIRYLREKQPMGTGGALSLLPDAPKHPVVVMNGDLVTQVDLSSMLDFHARGGQAATVGVRPYVHVVPYGCIELDETQVKRFLEKPRITRVVNAGVYVFNPALVARVPRDREYPITDLLEDALARKEPVSAFEITDEWTDVGRHDDLKRAKEGTGGQDGL